jgi:hypothetical protein
MTKTKTNIQAQADNITELLSTLHTLVTDLIDEVDKLDNQARIDAIRDFELDELDFYLDNNKTPILSVYDL